MASNEPINIAQKDSNEILMEVVTRIAAIESRLNQLEKTVWDGDNV